jgi:hypothetical protein
LTKPHYFDIFRDRDRFKKPARTPLVKQNQRRCALKTYFVTPGKLFPGIKNSSKNGTLLIGDKEIASTILLLHETLQGSELLTDVSIRPFCSQPPRYRRIPSTPFSTVIPSSSYDDRALLLAAFPAETSYGETQWRSVRAPDSEERFWLEENGLALNANLLWDGIHQYAYGQYRDYYDRAVVRRLLTLQAKNGLLMRNGDWGLCVYWNGFHLDKTGIMPLPELRKHVSAIL